MGDGCAQGSGMVLCTNSFTIPDVVKLMNILIIRYQLKCTLQSDRGKPRIYISASQLEITATYFPIYT